jgi:hypothetical protein
MKPIISVEEARKILGKDANGMSDKQIADAIETLDILAKDALETARVNLLRKKDAMALANIIYDIYKDDKQSKS